MSQKAEGNAELNVSYDIVRAPKNNPEVKVSGHWWGQFEVDHFDKNGNYLGHYSSPNGITHEGVQYLINLGLNPSGSETQAAGWFMSLMNADTPTASDPTFADTDGGGSHAGWTELSGTTRVSWAVTDASGTERSITNSSGTTTDITIPTVATDTKIGGIFLIDNVSSDLAAQTIFSETRFSTEPTVNTGDVLKITYSVGIAASTDLGATP